MISSRVRDGGDHRLWTVIKIVLIVLLVGITLAAAAFEIVQGAKTGSKTNLALGALIATLPVLLYLALEKPFIFPFGLFVLLAPADPLLQLSPRFGTLTKLIALAAGLAFIFWIVRHRRYVKPDRVLYVWLALLIWMGLSVLWAIDQATAATWLVTYALFTALYVATSLIPTTEKQYKSFLIFIALSGIIGAAASVYLYHSGAFVHHSLTHGIVSERLMLKYEDAKLNPNFFATALLLPTAIVLTWALQRPWSLSKLGLMVTLAVMLGGIYVSGSRAAELALAVLIIYMIVRGRFKAQLISLSILTLLATFVMPNSPWLRFSTAVEDRGSGRLSIWEVGLTAFKHHWFSGAGLANFPTAYNQSFISVHQHFNARWSRVAHNTPLQFAVELGVIGLVLLLTAWYMQMQTLRVIPRSSWLFDTRIALEGMLVASFVNALFLGVMEFKITWVLFMLVMVTRSVALRTARAAQPLWFAAVHPAFKFRHNAERPVKGPINAR